MIVHCKRARLSIALSVGGDLDDDGEWELSAHLESCEDCRRYRAKLQADLPTLAVAQETPRRLHDSVWPDLVERLPARRTRRLPEFNGWFAAIAVCIACAVPVLFWKMESTERSPSVAAAPVAATQSDLPQPVAPVDSPTTPVAEPIEFTETDVYVMAAADREPRPARNGLFRIPIEFFLRR